MGTIFGKKRRKKDFRLFESNLHKFYLIDFVPVENGTTTKAYW